MAAPADKSKHAPSPKHTLDEVLRSLQDLVRNELHDTTADPAAPPIPPAASTDAAAAPTADEMIARLEASLAELQPASRLRQDAQSATSASTANSLAADVTAPADAVELSPSHEDKWSTPADTQSSQIQHIADDAARTLQDLALPPATPGDVATAPPVAAADSETPGITFDAKQPAAAVMQQQALPLPDPVAGNDPLGASGAVSGHPVGEPETIAATPVLAADLPDAQPAVDAQSVPGPEITAEITATEGASAASDTSSDLSAIFIAGSVQEGRMGQILQASTEVDVNWDDFPVLENAVDLASVTSSQPAEVAKAAATGGMPPKSTADGAAVATIDAHRLAIMAAARLNMELRKSGKRTLSTAVIARLAQILKEMLAQGAANVENSHGKEN